MMQDSCTEVTQTMGHLHGMTNIRTVGVVDLKTFVLPENAFQSLNFLWVQSERIRGPLRLEKLEAIHLDVK